MPISKLITMYAIFDGTFRSFKALERTQRYERLLAEHNAQEGNEKFDEDQVLSHLDKEEVVPMLHFWVCFAFVQLYDVYIERFLSWIPFYYMIKVVLLLWIIIPQTRGATVVFGSFITPQIEKRMQVFEEKVFPIVRGTILTLVIRLEHAVMDFSLKTVSNSEIDELESTTDRLTRMVTREGYLRRREESIKALQEALPDEKQRIALLDDILKEYTFDPENDSDWSEVRLANEDGVLRVRFGSELDTEDEVLEFLEEEATVDNGL